MGQPISRSLAFNAFWCLALIACQAPGGKEPRDAQAPEGSLAWIEQRIIDNPDDAALFAQRAAFFEGIDSLALAEADWKRAIVLDSANSAWRLALGGLYFRKVRLVDAERSFQQAIELAPTSTDARSKLSELYLVQGRFKEAMAVANDALRLDPQNGRLYNLKGWIHRTAGDTDLAISSYQTAVERDPDLYDAYISLGILHAARHDALALDYYDAAIAERPTSIEAHYNKAMFAQEHDRDSLALACYARIKEIDPDYPLAYYNTGYILLEHQKKTLMAREQFQRAIAKMPTYTQAWYSRGVTYELEGRLDSAKADYEQTLRIDPTHTEAALGLSRLAAKGVKVKAR